MSSAVLTLTKWSALAHPTCAASHGCRIQPTTPRSVLRCGRVARGGRLPVGRRCFGVVRAFCRTLMSSAVLTLTKWSALAHPTCAASRGCRIQPTTPRSVLRCGRVACGGRLARAHVSLPSRLGIESLFTEAGFTEIKLVPDSLPNCAGAVGLTLAAGGATSMAYGRSGARLASLKRLLTLGAALLSVPRCVFDNLIGRRPAFAIIVASKTAEIARHGGPQVLLS